MNRSDIARIAHEVNRAYCQALGDNSQPTWEQAPEWQRSSAMSGVNLHITKPDAGPQASHESWMEQKIAEGWVYGPVKNPDLKQHHCIVPFDQLPREQQAKDFIFRGVVHALAQHLSEGPSAANPERPLTYGEKAVGLTFNPSGDPTVYSGKSTAAAFIDRAHELRATSGDPEVKRMAALAITHAQEAQMWLTKAQTWRG